MGDKKLTKSQIIEEVFDWIESIIYSILVAIFIFTFILRTATVNGESMVPTLQHADKIIVSDLFYTPKVHDIVIVKKNEALKEDIVKRVIATEGQEVNIDFELGKVYVNGIEQYEPFINDITMLDEGGHIYPVVVPDGCYFVMGDNRNNSRDSRDADVGFVSKDDILGRAIFRIWPFKTFGLLV